MIYVNFKAIIGLNSMGQTGPNKERMLNILTKQVKLLY